jgi:phosphate-selective porin OprO and OprP
MFIGLWKITTYLVVINIMKNKLIIIAVAGLALPLFAADNSSTNDTEAAEIAALKKEIQALEQKVETLEQKPAPEQQTAQVQDLDQKIRILERERELDQEAAAAAEKTAPKFSLGANGFSFSSADSNFVANLHGLIQADSRTFPADGGIRGNDGFILRRARPIFTGTVFHDFDFNFTPDFGGSTVQILDAYLNYRLIPEFQVEAGKFKSPVGLEALQSDTVTAFNERSMASDLVPNRDLGVELHGDLFNGALSYAVGIFDGTSDYNGTTANVDYDDDKTFAGRIFAQPWKNSGVKALQGLGFGLGGSYEIDRSATNASSTSLTPGYATDGQQKFFSYSSGVFANGSHWRLSPQAYYYYGPLSLLAEYVVSDQNVTKGTTTADLQNTAWQVSGGWVLTGESASYTGITPKHPFDVRKNQWGAWQVVARYSSVDIDKNAFPTFANLSTSASAAHEWAFGINWYLNKNFRVNTSFSHTQFVDGKSGAVTRQPENALFTRFQLTF